MKNLVKDASMGPLREALRQGIEAAVFNILGASTMMIGDPIFSDSDDFGVSPFSVSADGSFDEHMIR